MQEDRLPINGAFMQAGTSAALSPSRKMIQGIAAGVVRIQARPGAANDEMHPHFKVATYNIHLGIGRDGRFDPDRIATVIDELEADVICLQEVALGKPGFDMLEFLARECGLQGIPGPTLTTSRGDYGNAILTRHPHVGVERWNLSVQRREPRGAIAMQVESKGGRLRVVATHLGLWPAERRRQIRKLIAFMQVDRSVPTVLMGDVNEWFLWGRPLRWLHRHFEHAPAPASFPSGSPVFALDRVWVEPRRALHRVAAHQSDRARIASDHLPVTALIELSALGNFNPRTAAPVRQ